MRALRYHGRSDLRLDDVPEPAVTPGRVKVKIHWCGICGSDLHEYVKGPITMPTSDHPHPLTGESLPLTMGHEFAGEVVEVGAGVQKVAVGERVAVEPLLICRKCHCCRSGAYNRCVNFGAIGVSGGGGAYAEYIVVDPDFVHPLPVGVSTVAAAVAEPICVGWHAVGRSKIGPTQSALVIGAGPVGIGTLISLKAAHVEFVAVAENSSGARSAMAAEFGADLLIDTSTQSLTDEIARVTDGQGVDVVFEVAGVQATLDYALAAVKHGGTVVSICVWEYVPSMDMNTILAKEINLLGSQAYANEYPAVLQAIADGRIANPERMVTKRVSLDDALDQGFQELLRHRGDHVKILVTPWSSVPR
jgi:(R,R)-butanediol dehydrogenase / meso-butanediol dehydrogenase / diacetyl reductase